MNVTNGRKRRGDWCNTSPARGTRPALAAAAASAGVSARAMVVDIGLANPDGPLHAVAVGCADLATSRRATLEDSHYPWFSMTKIATATRRHDASCTLTARDPRSADRRFCGRLSGERAIGTPRDPCSCSVRHRRGTPQPDASARSVRPEDEPPDLAQQSGASLRRTRKPKRAVGSRASVLQHRLPPRRQSVMKLLLASASRTTSRPPCWTPSRWARPAISTNHRYREQWVTPGCRVSFARH